MHTNILSWNIFFNGAISTQWKVEDFFTKFNFFHVCLSNSKKEISDALGSGAYGITQRGTCGSRVEPLKMAAHTRKPKSLGGNYLNWLRLKIVYTLQSAYLTWVARQILEIVHFWIWNSEFKRKSILFTFSKFSESNMRWTGSINFRLVRNRIDNIIY